MSTAEQWLPVVGHEGAYEVSDRGNVRSLDREITTKNGKRYTRRGVALAPRRHTQGYPQVHLSGRGSVSIHRLVLEAFIGPCPTGLEACHNDGNPENNHAANLRWDTHAGNMQDRLAHGTCRNTAKTHCPAGHRLDAPNLVPAQLRRGYRNCRVCHNAREMSRRYNWDAARRDTYAARRYADLMGLEPQIPVRLSTATGNAGKTHCPAGHPYDDENTYRSPQGRRVCRACRREKARRRAGGTADT